MREQLFLNQGAVTVEVHTQLRNALNNGKSKNAIINHYLIYTTLIISVMNVTVGDQIHDSDVDRRII